MRGRTRLRREGGVRVEYRVRDQGIMKDWSRVRRDSRVRCGS